ncbi:tryptophan halogenase family protein [Cellvibrio sp. NN19]|uniref:tryptophan halogenase family protein n=1 Tax=Cellvibrio chitinivorans TaxID=3102792 RepID=UPI002B404BB7|nr:tryptophan halogenase family protein [Cellvibrio sp. NN19]
MSEYHSVKSIVIAGGGTAGWMAAAKLSKHFAKTKIKITLIESSVIGTVGVGEATIPTLRRFYQSLGMSDMDVMRKTSATVKLGIEFKDWHKPGTSFIHPFGLFGHQANGIRFHHYWMKLKSLGDTSKLEEYSLGIALARANRFTFPAENPSSALSVFDWALHFDASKFAVLMRDFAMENRVEHIDAKIESVQLNPENGFIQSLRLDNQIDLHGDLFIDCTGFNGLLIKGALKTDYINWSQWLLCDSALAVQSELVGEPAARTVSVAHKAGWQWKIPLQHRQGNGHVYSSQFIDDEEAETILLDNIEGKVLHKPRKFSFTAGRCAQAWNKNCIALGLASGFLEPLESTSIALIETGIEKICGSFPGPFFNQKNIDYFNQVTATEWEWIRDFIILHYKANQRTDSEFWQYCRAMNIPDTLKQKINAYQENGELLHFPWEIFHPDSWLAIYSGFNFYPETYDKNVDRFNPESLQQSLAEMRKSIVDAVSGVPMHQDFINEFCKTDTI